MTAVLTARATNPWARFAARRAGRLLVSLWVVVTAAFLMLHLIPGDPVRTALGPTATAELVATRRAALGLDQPLWQQYVDYLRGLFTGDLGVSMGNGLPVTQTIGDRLPATLELAVGAFLFAVVVSVPLGLLFAVLTRGGRRRPAELAFTSTSVVLAAVPEFLLAVGLVWVFSVNLGWVPVAGRGGFASYVLPVLALGLGPAAILARIVRVETLTVLRADFVRTARAKRLPGPVIYLRHVL